MSNRPPINAREGDVVMLDEPTDILCSFHYFRDADLGVMHRWGTRIIGDSGAFSAETSGNPIDREVFHAWASRWHDDLLWTASLDVIGNQAATQDNWLAAQRDGLDLVPTIHYPTDPKVLDWYVERGATLIGLGGMVAYSGEPQRLMRWLLSVFRYQRDNHPDLRFHGWGISHPLLMDNLPWWSADSSGFASAFRFATLRLFDVPRGRFVGVDLDGRSAARHARMLHKHYNGLDWRTISESTPATRRAVGRTAIKSVQHYGRWLRKRQQVSPPALLADRAHSAGPLPSAVMGFPGTAQMLALEPGPHTVAADTGWQAPSSAIHPGEDGPHVVGAVGRAGSSTAALPPQDRASAPSAGPWPVAARGAPSMQPTKALHPDDREGPRTDGPLLAAALASPRAGVQFLVDQENDLP